MVIQRNEKKETPKPLLEPQNTDWLKKNLIAPYVDALKEMDSQAW